jgi:hypothetical protein
MARQTTQEVNYRRGDPTEHCGFCHNFRGATVGCARVMGKISPYGICDLYYALTNEFGKTLLPAETATIKRIAAGAAARHGG